jgi:AAA domain
VLQFISLVGSLDEAWLAEIRTKLTACPEIKLLVIDPIFLAVRVKDANEYAPMMKALKGVREVAREFGVAIVCVHHSKKTMSADLGDHALGSTAIRASADATWQIIKKDDGKRTFQTEMRYGKDLPPTILIFDEDSRTSRLGGEEAELERRKAAINRDRIADAILDYVGKNPLQTRAVILEAVPYKSATKSAIFTELEKAGLIIATHAGVNGDPFLSTVNLPTEVVDA